MVAHEFSNMMKEMMESMNGEDIDVLDRERLYTMMTTSMDIGMLSGLSFIYLLASAENTTMKNITNFIDDLVSDDDWYKELFEQMLKEHYESDLVQILDGFNFDGSTLQNT